MAIDFLTVDFTNVVGEEFGDVFISRPVDRNAKVIAVFVFELLLQVFTLEPVITEPVKVRELLVRKLIKLAIRAGGERQTDEIFKIKGWEVTSLPSPDMKSESGTTAS